MRVNLQPCAVQALVRVQDQAARARATEWQATSPEQVRTASTLAAVRRPLPVVDATCALQRPTVRRSWTSSRATAPAPAPARAPAPALAWAQVPLPPAWPPLCYCSVLRALHTSASTLPPPTAPNALLLHTVLRVTEPEGLCWGCTSQRSGRTALGLTLAPGSRLLAQPVQPGLSRRRDHSRQRRLL